MAEMSFEAARKATENLTLAKLKKGRFDLKPPGEISPSELPIAPMLANTQQASALAFRGSASIRFSTALPRPSDETSHEASPPPTLSNGFRNTRCILAKLWLKSVWMSSRTSRTPRRRSSSRSRRPIRRGGLLISLTHSASRRIRAWSWTCNYSCVGIHTHRTGGLTASACYHTST